MNEYRQQWKQYRRRWIYFVAIFAGYVPVCLAVTVISAKLFRAEVLGYVSAVIWILLWIFSGLSINAWPCPRCGKCFIGRWWSGSPIWNSALTRCCAHCGLPKPEKALSMFPRRD